MDFFNFDLSTWSLTAVLEVIVVILSIAGQEYISRRNRKGFAFWLVGNLCGIAMFVLMGHPAMAALYSYYFVKCVQGLRHWSKLDEIDAAQAIEMLALKSGAAANAQGSDSESAEDAAAKVATAEMRQRVADLAYARLRGSVVIGQVGVRANEPELDSDKLAKSGGAAVPA